MWLSRVKTLTLLRSCHHHLSLELSIISNRNSAPTKQLTPPSSSPSPWKQTSTSFSMELTPLGTSWECNPAFTLWQLAYLFIFFHFACPQGSPMSQQESESPSLSRLDNIPLYVHFAFFGSIYPSVDTWVASAFWLLRIMLL